MSTTIFRARRRRQFVQLSHACLRDERLSLDAVGFLAVIISLPQNWTFNKVWARKRFGIGKEKLDRIVKELKAAGYCVVFQDHDPETGRFSATTYIFTDESGQFDEIDEPPVPEKPDTGEPVPGKPHTGKPATTYKRKTTNKENKKKAPPAKRTPPVARRPAPIPPEPEADPAMRKRVADLMREFAASLKPVSQYRTAGA